MSGEGRTPSEKAFDTMVQALLRQFGDDWIKDKSANAAFTVGTVALLQDAGGIHLIGDPEIEHDSHDFNIWIDFPVEDIMVADDVAFSIFSHLAEEIFVSTRIIEDRGVRYRFLTGSVLDGHLGSLNLTGTHAVEFVTMHRLKQVKGMRYNA
jgi:hypothetical protein